MPDFRNGPLWIRVLLDVAGVAVVGIGSALYIKAALGAGPRDRSRCGMPRPWQTRAKARPRVPVAPAMSTGADEPTPPHFPPPLDLLTYIELKHRDPEAQD